MTPTMRPTHHRCDPWVIRASVMSKMPLKRSTHATIDASATNVPAGRKKATIPAAMKITPRMPCTHFQPVVETEMARNSLIPTPMATMPNRIEIA